jgi:hypothetical protein
MKTLLAILVATLCAATSYAQVRKSVMVDTNGVVQAPANFWTANAGTNFQQYMAPFSQVPSNSPVTFLAATNSVAVQNSNSLQIMWPHALVRAGNDVFAFRRDAATGMNGNGSGVVFRGANTNLSDFTTITITNGGALPDAVYDASNNRIYVFATGQFTNPVMGGGIYSINPSNLATTLLSTNTTDIAGAITHHGEHIYLAGSNNIFKIAKSNGATVATLTITNLGSASNNIHALEVTTDGALLVGSTLRSGTNAAAFAVTLSNFALTNTTFNTNETFGVYTDDLAIVGNTAYLGAEEGFGALVSYNLTNFSKTTLFENQGIIYFVKTDGTNVFFGGEERVVGVYNPAQNRLFQYATTASPLNEIVFYENSFVATTYASNAAILSASLSRNIAPSQISIADVSGAAWALTSTSVVVTNTNVVALSADKFTRALWVNVSGTSDANININSIYNSSTNQRKLNDRVIVKNDGTNKVNVRSGITSFLLQSLEPQQQFEIVWVGQGSAGTNASFWEIINAGSYGLGATWLTNTNVTNFRSEIGLSLPALTNTSNVTVMRALAGTTNTNMPLSGTMIIAPANTYEMVVSNGIILDFYVQ